MRDTVGVVDNFQERIALGWTTHCFDIENNISPGTGISIYTVVIELNNSPYADLSKLGV